MGLLDLLKKKRLIKKTPEQRSNIKQVNLRHKNRISNLLEESEELSDKLLTIENDEDMVISKKSKLSDAIVQRLTLIKYEVGIRESLISWL